MSLKRGFQLLYPCLSRRISELSGHTLETKLVAQPVRTHQWPVRTQLAKMNFLGYSFGHDIAPSEHIILKLILNQFLTLLSHSLLSY
jgi:hypothetical protein